MRQKLWPVNVFASELSLYIRDVKYVCDSSEEQGANLVSFLRGDTRIRIVTSDEILWQTPQQSQRRSDSLAASLHYTTKVLSDAMVRSKHL